MRRHRFLLFLAAVFAAKLVVVLQLRDHPLLQPNAGLDIGVFTRLASEAAAGNIWLAPGLYPASPLYIYWLAAIVFIGKSFAAARVAQIALGTAAVGLVFTATRRWSGERAAWIAALLAALTGLFSFYEALLVPSALDPFLTAAALAALALGLDESGKRAHLWMAAAGFAFGVLTLNRPGVLIPAIAIAAMLAVSRRLTPAVLLAAGLATALLPFAIRNYIVAGDWSPASSHGGVEFYIGNNASADGTDRPAPGIAAGLEAQRADARRVAETSVGRRLDDGEVSAFFYELGWSWMRLHPGDALAHFVRKLSLVFNAGHIPAGYSYLFYAYDMRTLLAVLFAGPWLLLPLGLGGLALGVQQYRRYPYLIWASFVPFYAVAVALFFVTDRNRLPLLVPLCAGGGAALDFLIFTKRRLALRVLALAGVLTLAVFCNRPSGRDDGRAEERTRMAEAMIVRDRIEDAEVWGKKAEAIHPRPALVHFRMGRLLIVHSRPQAAVAHLVRALQLGPGDPDVNYAMGQALVDAGRPREAIPYLRDALRAGVRVNLAGYDLARALAATGDRAGALQTLQGVRPDSASDLQSWDALGQLALQLQSPSLAAAFFAEAVAAGPRSSKPHQDLGRALAMMGRHAEAIAQFEQAVALDAADPAAQLNLAVAYAEAGRTTEARARAQEALRLKPDYERARQFLGVLR